MLESAPGACVKVLPAGQLRKLKTTAPLLRRQASRDGENRTEPTHAPLRSSRLALADTGRPAREVSPLYGVFVAPVGLGVALNCERT